MSHLEKLQQRWRLLRLSDSDFDYPLQKMLVLSIDIFLNLFIFGLFHFFFCFRISFLETGLIVRLLFLRGINLVNAGIGNDFVK